METTSKNYAVKCSTEEQARECYELKLAVVDDTIDAQKESTFEAFGYTIITYYEAKEKGLLGEKKVCKYCLGKKQNSVYKGDKVLQPDFIGDGRYLLEGEGITMVDCSRCKGTGLEPEYIPEIEPQQNEVQKTQEEITAYEQMETNEMINEESPREDSLVEKEYKFQCRKCKHILFVGANKLPKLQDIDCPACGEEGGYNWIFQGEGNYKKEKNNYKLLSK